MKTIDLDMMLIMIMTIEIGLCVQLCINFANTLCVVNSMWLCQITVLYIDDFTNGASGVAAVVKFERPPLLQ